MAAEEGRSISALLTDRLEAIVRERKGVVSTQVLQELKTGGPVRSSPAVADGILCVGSERPRWLVATLARLPH